MPFIVFAEKSENLEFIVKDVECLLIGAVHLRPNGLIGLLGFWGYLKVINT